MPTTTLAGALGSIPEALPQDYRLIPESSLGDSMYQGKPPHPMFRRRPGDQVSDERTSMSSARRRLERDDADPVDLSKICIISTEIFVLIFGDTWPGSVSQELAFQAKVGVFRPLFKNRSKNGIFRFSEMNKWISLNTLLSNSLIFVDL